MINVDEAKESLLRCGTILFYSRDLNELIRNIKQSVNSEYTVEQCYRDLLITATFNWSLIREFLIYLIESNDLEGIDIIIDNIHFLPSVYLIELIKQNNKALELILENFKKVFQNLDDQSKASLITELNKSKVGKNLLMEQIKNDLIKDAGAQARRVILNNLFNEQDGIQIILEKFDDFFIDGFDFGFLDILMKKGISEEKILENKEKILKKSYGANIIKFIDWLCKKDSFKDDDISLENFISLLYHDIKDTQSLKMLETLYKKLLEEQGLTLKDIKVLGKGEYSQVYGVGMFSLKTGDTRQTRSIPYHRRILQPLVRQESNPECKNNSIYIEIQNVVDSNWYIGMSEQRINEELYKIYKEMRRDGIIWTDIKKSNVGRLIRPNKSNYYTDTLEGDINDEKTLRIIKKELEISDESVGIVGRVQEECLHTGELVIFDTDFIFKEEDINIEQELNSKKPPRFIFYERRYLQELEREKQSGQIK